MDTHGRTATRVYLLTATANPVINNNIRSTEKSIVTLLQEENLERNFRMNANKGVRTKAALTEFMRENERHNSK